MEVTVTTAQMTDSEKWVSLPPSSPGLPPPQAIFLSGFISEMYVDIHSESFFSLFDINDTIHTVCIFVFNFIFHAYTYILENFPHDRFQVSLVLCYDYRELHCMAVP